MSFARALSVVVVGLELVILIALRVQTELDESISRLLTVGICLVLASLIVLIIRVSPTWLVCIALLISGLPIVLGWLFLSILTGIAGK